MIKKALISLLLVFILCLVLVGSFADILTLTVQGTAVITTVPDIVIISANANVTSASAMDAQTKISEMIAKMRSQLLLLGISDDDIVTQNYNFYPQYRYSEETEILIGYQANHSVDITCRDLNKVNEILTAITESGITQLYNISYSVSNRSEIYRSALCEAVDAARKKAELIASSCGYSTVSISSIEEINNSYSGETLYGNVTREEVAADKQLDTEINSGNISVTASVNVIFSVE